MFYIGHSIWSQIIASLICYYGCQLTKRKEKTMLGAALVCVLGAALCHGYFRTTSVVISMVWNVLLLLFLFEVHWFDVVVLSGAIAYFTKIADTFSLMVVQAVLMECQLMRADVFVWTQMAPILSLGVYLIIYHQLLQKNGVYLCDIEYKYKIVLFIQGGIFQMFYRYVISFILKHDGMYEGDIYVTFLISILGVMFSIYLTLSLAIKNVRLKRQNSELQVFIYAQDQQFHYQMKQSEIIRGFKHDFVNHIGALRELLYQKKPEEALKYIEEIWNIQEGFNLIRHTGDGFLDVIVNYFMYMSEKEKIQFEVIGKLSGKLALEMVDLTALIGNVLQNAMEAAKKADFPKIKVEFMERKNETFIVVSNSSEKLVKIRNGTIKTTKPDRMNHGFGLKNTAAIIKKYHGEYYMESYLEQGEPILKISIAVPKGDKNADRYR